jgi:hypothetical protein
LAGVCLLVELSDILRIVSGQIFLFPMIFQQWGVALLPGNNRELVMSYG